MIQTNPRSPEEKSTDGFIVSGTVVNAGFALNVEDRIPKTSWADDVDDLGTRTLHSFLTLRENLIIELLQTKAKLRILSMKMGSERPSSMP